MIYLSEFTALNGISYKVEIDTPSGSGTKQFTLGGSPFVTSMDSDGKNIYTPIKSTGATIEMVTPDIPFDVYSGNPLNIKVKLTNTTANKVEWVGYVEPLMFDMGFDENRETIEIECVDGLAVLKDIKYQSTSANHEVETFGNVINQCLKQSGVFKNLYVTDNVQLSINGTDSIIDKFRISQQNFFDKKDDINQLDEDVAWNCYDVLFEICQYLGYTMFCEGEDVMMIDYDAIKANDNNYFKYTVGGDTLGAYTKVTKKYTFSIDGESYSENGTKVSLDEVYNKVSVKDDFYTFDSIFPEFGDENFEENITLHTEDIGMRYYHQNNVHYTNMESDIFERRTTDGKKDITYQIFTVKGWRNRMWVVIVKFYKSPVLEFKHYEHRSSARADESADYEKDMSWSRIFNAHGATYYKIWKKEISSKEFNEKRANYDANWHSMPESRRWQFWRELLGKDPSKISLEPLIVCYKEYARNPIKNEEVTKFPFIRLRSESNPASLGGEGAYIIIKGSVLYHDEYCTPFPLSDGADNGKLKRDVDWKYASECHLKGMLKWGDQYWDGEAWNNSYTTFNMQWRELTRGRKEQQNEDIYDKFFEFIDTAQSKYGCDEKGIYIPVPQDGNLSGGVEFQIFCPHDMKGNSRKNHWTGYDRYYSKVICIKNLKIEAKISNGLLDDKDNNSDTIYTNVIPSDNYKEASQITFKICTFDNKKPTYSAVDYLVNGKSQYVTKTVNKALNNQQNGDISAFDQQPLLTQEEQLIFKLVSQYEEPRVIFEANLHNDGHRLYGIYTDKTLKGRKFIAEEIHTDYKMNQQTVKLIEKF